VVVGVEEEMGIADVRVEEPDKLRLITGVLGAESLVLLLLLSFPIAFAPFSETKFGASPLASSRRLAAALADDDLRKVCEGGGRVRGVVDPELLLTLLLFFNSEEEAADTLLDTVPPDAAAAAAVDSSRLPLGIFTPPLSSGRDGAADKRASSSASVTSC
jgi:hypothetical protein